MQFRDRIIAVALPIALLALVGAVWAMCAVSVWIVSHDHVWQEMKADGDHLEWYLAEGFTQLHSLGVVPATAALTVVVLLIVFMPRLTK
jgi:hypothetical protein